MADVVLSCAAAPLDLLRMCRQLMLDVLVAGVQREQLGTCMAGLRLAGHTCTQGSSGSIEHRCQPLPSSSVCMHAVRG